MPEDKKEGPKIVRKGSESPERIEVEIVREEPDVITAGIVSKDMYRQVELEIVRKGSESPGDALRNERYNRMRKLGLAPARPSQIAEIKRDE